MATGTTQLILETLVKGSEQARAQLDSMEKQVNGFQKTASLLGTALTSAFAAFSLAKVTKTFMEYEDQLAGVSKTTGLQGEELKKLGDDLLAYSGKTRTGINDLLSISQIGGQLGIAGEDVGAFTQAIDKLNVALGDEFSGGVEQITKDVSGMRLIFKDVQSDNISDDLLNIGNALNVLGASGSATGEVMAQFSSRMGGVLAPLGATAGEVIGLSATLQELQVAPERGSSAVTRAVQIMGKDIEGFAKIAGVSGKEFANLYNTDVMGAFALVTAQIKNSSQSNTEFIKTLDEAGLDGVYTSEVMGKLGSNMDLLGERITQANEALNDQTSIQSEFDKMNNTMAASVSKLWNSLNNLAINFIGVFAKPLTAAINGIVWVLQTMIEWGGKIQEGFAQWSESSTPAAEAFNKIKDAVLGFIDTVVKELKDWVKIIGDIFAQLWEIISPVVMPIFNFIRENFDSIMKYIKNVANMLFQPLVTAFNVIYGVVKSFLQLLGGDWEGAWETIKNTGKKVWDSIVSFFTSFAENFDMIWGNLWRGVTSFFSNAWNTISTGVSNGISAVVGFFAALPGKVMKFITNLLADVVNGIVSLPGKLWEGLVSGGTKITSWLGNLWTEVKDGIWKIVKGAYDWGANVVGNFIDGLLGKKDAVAKASEEIATATEDYIGFQSPTRKGPGKDADKWGAGAINAFVKGLQDGKGIVASAAQASANVVSTAFDGVRKFVSKSVKGMTVDTKNALVVMASDARQILDPLFAEVNNDYNDFYNRSSLFPDKLKKPFEGMYNAFRDTQKKISDSMNTLGADLTKGLDDINSKIVEATRSLTDLKESFKEKIGGENMELAKAIFDQQKKIDGIKQEVVDKQKEYDNELEDANRVTLSTQLDELQASLQKEERALMIANSEKSDIEEELATVKRRARQSDFENFMEDWFARREVTNNEFAAEKELIESKISLYQSQSDKMKDAYSDALSEIKRMQRVANTVYENAIDQQVLATEAGTNLMKQYFDNVTDSVSNLAGALGMVGDNSGALMTANEIRRQNQANLDSGWDSSRLQMIEKDSSYIPPIVAPPSGGDIYVTVENMYGEEEYAMMMGTQIARQLGLNNAF